MAQTALATAFVNIVPSAKGFGKKLQNDIDPQLDASGVDGGKRFGGGLVNGIKAMAGPIAAVLGTVAIAGFFKDSVKAASDLSESQNAVSVTFGDAAESIKELGASAARELGLSNVQFNELAVRFSSFAKQISGPGGNVTATLDEMTRRASDFASVMNIEVADAAEIFQSGLAGETEPLKKFGIDLSAAAVEAYAMANGIGTAGKEMSEAEKVQARYGLLMEQTALTQGDFANTSDGLANGMRILRSTFEDVKANIGTAFLPFMAMGVQALNYMMGPVQTLSEAFSNFGTNIGEVFSGAGGGIAGFQAVLDNLTTTVSAWFAGGGLTQAFNAFSMLRVQFFEAILNAIPGIIDGFVQMVPQIAGFIVGVLIPSLVTQFASLFTSLVNLIATAVPQVVTAIAQILPILVGQLAVLLPQIITTLLGLIPMLLESALIVFQSIVTALVQTIPVIVTTLVEMLPVLIDTIVTMLPGIIQAAMTLFDGIIKGLLEVLPMILQAIIDILPPLIESLLTLLPEIIIAAVELFLGLVTGLAEALPQIITAIINMIPKLTTTLVNMIPQLITAAVTLFIGIVTGLSKALPQIISAVIGMIPMIVGALIGAMPQMIAAGFQLLVGLIKGIIDNAPRLIANVVKSLGDLLVNGVKSFFGIKSPSRVFMGIGEMLMVGLADGISDSQKEVVKAMDKVNSLVDAGMSANVMIGTDAPAISSPLRDFESTSAANGMGNTVNYYAAPNQSIDAEQALFTAMKRAKVLAAW
jgi:phage-related protein